MNQFPSPTSVHLGDAVIELPSPLLEKVKLDDDSWIVVFDWKSLPKEICARNVWRIDKTGKKIWEIESGPTLWHGPSPWISISYVEQGFSTVCGGR